MNTLFVAARAIHYASAIVLLGELVFASVVAPSGWRDAAPRDAVYRSRIFRFISWAIIASLLSGAIWFVVEAAVMSGTPLAAAIDRETLGVVLHDTSFGRVWTARAGLLVALCVIGIAIQRSTSGARTSLLCASGALVAAAYLGMLAWAGHAAAGQSAEDTVQTSADVVHLLAAGAWLGSLPALVAALGATRPDDVAARAAGRFSTLGLISVITLIASGLVNAWYQVGSAPALFGTLYGRLLLAKLALFATMIVVAVVNRGYLAPRVAGADRGARRALRRNALVEIVLGLGVVAVVGRLGITVPAAHQSTFWPFEHTLSTVPMEQSAWIQLVLAAAGIVAFAALIFLLKGVFSRPPRVRLGTLAAIVVPIALFAWLLVVPAHPTTYLVSPIAYTTSAVAAGAALYASNCAACHGREGGGEAVSAASRQGLQDLAELVPERREGDLFWSIAHGVPGTSMPGYAPRLAEDDIWKLIQFLDAQAAARNAEAMTDRVKPLRPVLAPDFTYELAGRPQESLLGARDNRVTLLVLYTLPQSLPRLVEIAAKLRAYARAGARVIAVPMESEPAAVDAADTLASARSIAAAAGADVPAAYLLFALPGARPRDESPTHVEYLIDRDGGLRVRWIGAPDPSLERSTETLAQIDLLAREPPRPPLQWGHRH